MFLLFSDPNFAAWLLRRKYLDRDFPAEVQQALEEARRSYLREIAVFGVIVVVASGAALANRAGLCI